MSLGNTEGSEFWREIDLGSNSTAASWLMYTLGQVMWWAHPPVSSFVKWVEPVLVTKAIWKLMPAVVEAWVVVIALLIAGRELLLNEKSELVSSLWSRDVRVLPLKVLQRFRFLIYPPPNRHSKLSLAWSASLICQQDSNIQTELTIAEGGGTKEAVQQHRIAHLRGFKRPTKTSYLCQSRAIIALGGPMQVKLSVTKGSPDSFSDYSY